MSDLDELRLLTRLAFGPARTAATERLVRRIEAEGPKDQVPEALLALMKAYSLGRESYKAFVVLARTLRLWDADPGLFGEVEQNRLFWQFKWVTDDLADYPQISNAQATALLDDMERRFALQGNGNRSVLEARFVWEWQSGIVDAEQSRLVWAATPEDDYSNCGACVIGEQTEYLLEQGRYQEALDIGSKQTGTCGMEPAKTYHAMALAAFNVGEPREAVKLHHKAMSSERAVNTRRAASRGQSFELLARGGQLERALRQLRSGDRDLLVAPETPLQQLRYLLRLIAGLSANRDDADLRTGVVIAGAAAPGQDATLGELLNWATASARELAGAFDARSGTAHYAGLLEHALSATLGPKPLEVSAAAATEPQLPAPVAEAISAAETEFEAAEAHVEAANDFASSGEFVAAIREYERAGELFAEGGWIAQQGRAAAEAGQCASRLEEHAAAHACFARAVPLLRAGGADAGVIAAVLTKWAPVAASVNDAGQQVRASADVLAELAEIDPLSFTGESAERDLLDWQTRRATLRDTLARSIGAAQGRSFGDGLDIHRAAAEALQAGEEFAALGRVSDAAHAFWLVGKLQELAGDSEAAVWGYESAFEGFSATGNRTERAEVVGELIALLRATGQPDAADEIIAQL